MVKRDTFGLVLPFYNEEEYLRATLACLTAQTRRPDQVVLVDNGSTDASGAIAAEFAASYTGSLEILTEPKPGKVHALTTGCVRLQTRWTTTWDADTHYPPHYFSTLARLSAAAECDVVALMAPDAGPDPLRRGEVMRARLALHRRFPSKCFAGGAGQTFRSDVLNRVGGFDEHIWPYVLMDHEIVHRVHQHGVSVYDEALWFSTSDRRTDRGRVRWTLFERMMYRRVPQRFEPWYFHSFLAGRFEARGLRHGNLREQPWQDARARPELDADASL